MYVEARKTLKKVKRETGFVMEVTGDGENGKKKVNRIMALQI